MDYKKTIMRKVYTIWLFRKVFNVTTAKIAGIVALAWQSTSYISIGHVIENLPSLGNVSGLYNFTTSAIMNTEIITQLLMLGIVMLVVLLVRDGTVHSTERDF